LKVTRLEIDGFFRKYQGGGDLTLLYIELLYSFHGLSIILCVMGNKTKVLVDLIICAGYSVRSYSGRSMYGKECLGVTCDDTHKLIVDVIEQAIEEDNGENSVIEDTLEVMKDSRTDSMGRSSIIYWPSVEFSREDAIEFEDDDENCAPWRR
jgi:hypothetical protein